MKLVPQKEMDITADELEMVYSHKHAVSASVGWGPQRRKAAGYYMPADYYEALVSKCVTSDTEWLDVGGGSSPFRTNPRLAEILSKRARLLVGVDPSDNIDNNSYIHEGWKGLLEDYRSERRFDLATIRMVVEHVKNPQNFVEALDKLLRPGGKVVIFTVNAWSPVTVVSRVTPFRFHYPIKRLFWGGDEKDTFPTVYKMNTRRSLARLFCECGFTERYFRYLDDLSVFSRFKMLNFLELSAWKAFATLGCRYPENCILAIYEKTTA